MYEAMHGGQQTTLDELEYEAYIYVSNRLKRKWKVEILGDTIIATSTDELRSGAGIEVNFNRITGEMKNNMKPKKIDYLTLIEVDHYPLLTLIFNSQNGKNLKLEFIQ